MPKKYTSYTAPFCGVCTLLYCEYLVIMMRPNLSTGILIFLIFYTILVVMALWSYFSAMLSDPGYVPHDYEYDLSRMSRLTAALYRHCDKYQAEKIDIT